MSTKSNELINNYLARNPVVQSLEARQYNTLYRLLHTFAVVKEDETLIAELVDFAAEKIKSPTSFDHDLAEVSNKALSLMLEQ